MYFALLNKLREPLTKRTTHCRDPIPAEIRLALTLRYLALGDGFRTLHQIFRVGLSTSRLIILETCEAIISALGHSYLRTPNTRTEWLEIAQKFNDKWNFPNCLGAIDGKHVRMFAPRKSGSLYFNYKDFFSIVLLAIVDSEYRFIYIDIGSQGRASDGGIWGRCSFHDYLYKDDNPLNIPGAQNVSGAADPLPYFFVADDAFPLGPNIMKPFPG